MERLFSPWCPNKVVLHRLSLAKFDPNTRKWGVVIKNGLVSPVFSTADSVLGYKIVCNSFSFWMYNELGLPRRPGGDIAELKVFDSWGLATSRR